VSEWGQWKEEHSPIRKVHVCLCMYVCGCMCVDVCVWMCVDVGMWMCVCMWM